MRNSLFVTGVLFLSCSCVSIVDHDGQVEGKGADSQQSLVSVTSKTECSVLVKNTTVLDLKEDSNQIVCREERVSQSSGLTTRRCKARAEFRSEDGMNRMIAEEMIENDQRRQTTRASGNKQRAPRLQDTD